MAAWGDIFGYAVIGAATGVLTAYLQFLWRCSRPVYSTQPIKHWSEDFTDCAWGEVVDFPRIVAPVDFEIVKAGVETSTGEGVSKDASLLVRTSHIAHDKGGL